MLPPKNPGESHRDWRNRCRNEVSTEINVWARSPSPPAKKMGNSAVISGGAKTQGNSAGSKNNKETKKRKPRTPSPSSSESDSSNDSSDSSDSDDSDSDSSSDSDTNSSNSSSSNNSSVKKKSRNARSSKRSRKEESASAPKAESRDIAASNKVNVMDDLEEDEARRFKEDVQGIRRDSSDEEDIGPMPSAQPIEYMDDKKVFIDFYVLTNYKYE